MRQTILNGILLGSNYALLAVGYTLVFGVTRLLTLAHGEIFTASAVVAVVAMNALDVPVSVAILIAVAVGTAGGIATDVLCFRPLARRSHLAPAVATIGLAIAVQDAIELWLGSPNTVGLPADIGGADFELGGILLSGVQLVTLAVSIVLLVATYLFVFRTRWGTAMRAMAEDPAGVELSGVNPKTIATLTLAASGFLSGFGGILLALRVGSVSPLSGLQTGLVGLAIMAIGGMGSLPGAILAGIAVGLAESLFGFYGSGGYGPAVPWILVIAALLVRPRARQGAGVR